MADRTLAEIRELLRGADERQFAAIERSLVADSRKGVKTALATARKRLHGQKQERDRLEGLYAFERSLLPDAGKGVIVGLDEVGRGPLAGPLAVGAVVLPEAPLIEGLNDSKQLSPERREAIADQVKQQAIAWCVEYVAPADIDSLGMSACLRRAFSNALARIERSGTSIDLVLVDGNPLHIDPREVNIVKGDAKCASIAAASIVAKTERDALMCELAELYPEYGFEQNKGYGSAQHADAIREHGLSPMHRKSFCRSFMQETLF